MKNIEIYNQDFFKLPKKADSNDYLGFVTENLGKFLTYLDKFEGDLGKTITDNKDNIVSLCDAINKSLDYYLKGFTVKSYNVLEKELNKIKDYLLYPKEPKILLASDSVKSFYRLRFSKQNLKDARDLFHVPFQLRFLIQSYRYSISGLPCVYLGNSLDLCWQELRKPNICFLSANRYDIDVNQLNFINLTFTPQRVVYLNKPYIEAQKDKSNYKYLFLEESIITWPLSFVCSIPTKKQNSEFKIEYIIPQLIMQWIQENTDLDGIMYFSSIAEYFDLKGFTPFHINIAMPVRSNMKEGYCTELSKKLKMTQPVQVKNYRHLRKKEPKKPELDDWLIKSSDSYMNYIARSMNKKKNSLLLLDKVEMSLIKMDTNYI